MVAAMEGNTSIGELLLERGAKTDEVNNVGETALSLAAHKGHIRFIRMLLRSGASPDVRPHGTTLENWLRAASSLPSGNITSILEILEAARLERQARG
jgi:ankyrin repeat protein